MYITYIQVYKIYKLFMHMYYISIYIVYSNPGRPSWLHYTIVNFLTGETFENKYSG